MKRILLAVNHSYLFFGATLYVGVLWALRFFWYPSWSKMTVDSVQDHFILPTNAATRFFTVVVPLMFLASIVFLVTEWKTRFRWTAILSLLCISAATYVGWLHIIPVNKLIKAGVADQAQLTPLFKQWMMLNDIRWVLLTVMWLTLMYYFIAKGNLLQSLAGRPRSSRATASLGNEVAA
jgi:glucan phosphoethanolaminetransferase (alkaline phosphatase superfamily)